MDAQEDWTRPRGGSRKGGEAAGSWKRHAGRSGAGSRAGATRARGVDEVWTRYGRGRFGASQAKTRTGAGNNVQHHGLCLASRALCQRLSSFPAVVIVSCRALGRWAWLGVFLGGTASHPPVNPAKPRRSKPPVSDQLGAACLMYRQFGKAKRWKGDKTRPRNAEASTSAPARPSGAKPIL